MHRGELSSSGPKSVVADVILGGQDGLVNVLGLILGVAAASQDVRIILAGGLAATFAESISMAAVALTSKMAQRDHFQAEMERERQEIRELPDKEAQEVRAIFEHKGFKGKILDDIVEHIRSDEQMWLELMMKDELNLIEVTNKEIYTGSVVVGLSAIVGSFIPLLPFFYLPISSAIVWAVVLSCLALLIGGIYKAKKTIGNPLKSGIQMVLIGMGAALAGYLIGRLFGQ